MFQVFELLSSVNAKFFKLLSPILKDVGLSVTETIILWKINKKGLMRITDVAREVGVPASTLTGLFDRLSAQGYLERIHDEKDRRSILLKGTQKLCDTIDQVTRFAQAELTRFFDDMPEDFLERLMQDLNRVNEQLMQKGIGTNNEQTK